VGVKGFLDDVIGACEKIQGMNFFFLTNKLGETPHLEHVIDLLALVSRAVDPEPKQFWMTGGGAKKFQMVEPKI